MDKKNIMTRARDVANIFTHSNALASDTEVSTALLEYKKEIIVSVNSDITMLSGRRYAVDTNAARTLTLPASPLVGDEVQVMDGHSLAGTNNITIDSNGNKMHGVVQNAIIDVNGAMHMFIYTGSAFGWRMI